MIPDPITAVSAKHASSLWAVGLILLFSVALHVILFSLFKPIPRNVKERSQSSRFTVLCSPKDVINGDVYELRYWLCFMDPESFVKPDPAHGFSLVRSLKTLSPPNPEEFQHDLFALVSDRSIQKKNPFRARSLKEFESGFDLPVEPHSSPPKIPAVEAQYPVWTDEKGQIRIGLFLQDEESMRILARQKSGTPTVLHLFLQNGMPPEVQVVRSSGNRTLDLLAKRQLAVYIGNLSLPETEKYFTVTWQAPPLLSDNGGSK